MKLQCNACEAAEAAVLCCADEVVLCSACDERVHAVNKLAGKHHRVALIAADPSSRAPVCDVCQEAAAFFFCLEDRAVLCRKCDVSIHTANPYVSAHQRFLLTGVQVGLELKEPARHLVNEQFSSSKTNIESPVESLIKGRPHVLSFNETHEGFSSEVGEDRDLLASKVSFSCAIVPGTSYDWPSDDFFEMFDPNFEFTEHGSSSKADTGELGSPLCRAIEELYASECL